MSLSKICMNRSLPHKKLLDKPFGQDKMAARSTKEQTVKIEFSEDDIKDIIIERARALCPTVEWETVEIDMSYGFIRKAVVGEREASDATQ